MGSSSHATSQWRSPCARAQSVTNTQGDDEVPGSHTLTSSGAAPLSTRRLSKTALPCSSPPPETPLSRDMEHSQLDMSPTWSISKLGAPPFSTLPSLTLHKEPSLPPPPPPPHEPFPAPQASSVEKELAVTPYHEKSSKPISSHRVSTIVPKRNPPPPPPPPPAPCVRPPPPPVTSTQASLAKVTLAGPTPEVKTCSQPHHAKSGNTACHANSLKTTVPLAGSQTCMASVTRVGPGVKLGLVDSTDQSTPSCSADTAGTSSSKTSLSSLADNRRAIRNQNSDIAVLQATLSSADSSTHSGDGYPPPNDRDSLSSGTVGDHGKPSDKVRNTPSSTVVVCLQSFH